MGRSNYFPLPNLKMFVMAIYKISRPVNIPFSNQYMIKDIEVGQLLYSVIYNGQLTKEFK